MRRVDDCIKSVLAVAGDDPEVQLIFLRELWPQIVGPGVAENTRPVGLAGRTLEISAADPVWAGQLKDLEDPIVRSVNRFWGRRVVERIRARLRPSQ
jgi:predicted nucleic acid-binding Zn ribbon protein